MDGKFVNRGSVYVVGSEKLSNALVYVEYLNRSYSYIVGVAFENAIL